MAQFSVEIMHPPGSVLDEKQHSTKQYESFQKTARQSPVVARAYAVVIVTQLFILLWYQWGASAFLLVTGVIWPSPGASVDWAYAILALCLGGGAFVFKRNTLPQ